ncbi:MAG: MBL fold metallo-hydrolase [Patescibacteria group bacterium]|nr:MBL fold metallo-hydrolase [Patescibacteria group bacterium]
MRIQTIETESLGNRGYLIDDGTVAIAIDVQRDYERWIDAATSAGVTITHVLETHMHNDYVTGGYQLAVKLNVAYVIPQHSGADFAAYEIADNEVLEIGKLKAQAIHTPGHTEHHMSFQLSDGSKSAVFTGGGILYGTVGRTDLVSGDMTKALTQAQYDSAQRLGNDLSDDAEVYPTHGFGSFCSSAEGSGASSSTIGNEKKSNIVFTAERNEFIRQIISGLGPYPRYYAHMGEANQAGPDEVKQLHIHSYAADEVGARLRQDNSWVIDTRSRKLFAAHHPQGAVGIELGKSFSTYAGWIVPWSDRLLLVGDTEQVLLDAYKELSRIGMDAFVEGATNDMHNYLSAGDKASYRVATFAELKANLPNKPFVLDVRQQTERNDSHIPGSHHIPLQDVLDRIDEIPDDEEIWVHCASGYRASIAASLLSKMGRTPVLVNDDYSKVVDIGLFKYIA